jgi:protein-S-isoprenylcysteine O-methyltransferase Ste14
MQPEGIAVVQRDRRSDWAGFAFFAGWTVINFILAAGVFRRTPAVAILLVPTFVHDAVIALAFLFRKPLRKQAEGWAPRAAAYGATLLVPVFCFVAGRWFPAWMAPSSPSLFTAGIAFWLVGAYLGVWSVIRLRQAFSIVPQARTLVTTGPYRLARHPVYASYLLQYAGVVLSHLTPALVLVYVAWLGVVTVRMSYEESVLSAVFPEYEDYQRRVGRFMPRLTWARKSKPKAATAQVVELVPAAKRSA